MRRQTLPVYVVLLLFSALQGAARGAERVSPEIISSRITYLHQSLNAGDLEAALSVFHEDVSFDWGNASASPWSGLGKGREDIRVGWAWNAQNWSDASYDILDITINGDVSLMRAREGFTVNATGNRVSCPVIAEYHWQGDEIIFWREYFCLAELLQAMGKVPAD